MRKLWVLAIAVGAVLAAEPAFAGKLQFSPDTFEIYGGLSNSPTKGSNKTRKISYSGQDR
jgi:hypothetical protein